MGTDSADQGALTQDLDHAVAVSQWSMASGPY